MSKTADYANTICQIFNHADASPSEVTMKLDNLALKIPDKRTREFIDALIVNMINMHIERWLLKKKINTITDMMKRKESVKQSYRLQPPLITPPKLEDVVSQ